MEHRYYLYSAQTGFLYLVAITDWFSRYVPSWRLSNSLDVHFCVEALGDALKKRCPEIFNSDQGSQFTSNDFTGILLSKGITISMDSRGRVFDNIFTKRLWRSVKYEDVYIKDYQEYKDTREGLDGYFSFYNNRRYHQSLEYKTPYEVHYGVCEGIKNYFLTRKRGKEENGFVDFQKGDMK